jgi:hypothetical protein
VVPTEVQCWMPGTAHDKQIGMAPFSYGLEFVGDVSF